MLTKLEIQGFKSIKSRVSLELGSLNVLIGANGTGKSNLISFFKLLNWMTTGELQFYVGEAGGANALLHDGADVTSQITASLIFQDDQGGNEYFLRLSHAASDTLIFTEERFRYTPKNFDGNRNWINLGAGHREALILDDAQRGGQTAKFILGLMKQCVVYQFHNTTKTARIRQKWRIDDNRFLKEDGANLAPFLLRLREDRPKYYARIVETVRQVTPCFVDFVLEPIGGTVMLQWRERETDIIFSVPQASDGTLRVIALVTLLLQPEDQLPLLVILDEPELGLHPYAVDVLAGLLHSASLHTQVILATQSTTLMNYMEPSQIIVVDRPRRESSFRHLDEEKLKDWLDEYSLAELWEKNVIGGRPA